MSPAVHIPVPSATALSCHALAKLIIATPYILALFDPTITTF